MYLDYGYCQVTNKWKVPSIMGGWNTLDDEPSYYLIPDKGTGNAPTVPQETTMVNIDTIMNFAEGKIWKVRKECTINSPEVQNLHIESNGLMGYVKDMLANGWIAELVTNDFTKKTRFYIFHEKMKLIGRGNWERATENGAYFLNLDFFGHCKDFKRTYRGAGSVRVRTFVGGEYFAPITMSVEELLLVCTAKLKGDIPPKKPVKHQISTNVIDLLERIKQRQHNEATIEAEKQHVI